MNSWKILDCAFDVCFEACAIRQILACEIYCPLKRRSFLDWDSSIYLQTLLIYHANMTCLGQHCN